jgi:hypothetical protein
LTVIFVVKEVAEEDDNGNVGTPGAMLLVDGWFIE